jgi:hypothetical protein
MARPVHTTAWFVAALAIATGLCWGTQRMLAEDDIPRFLRQSGPTNSRTTEEPPASQAAPVGQRLREGVSLANVPGTFQDAGERVAFHPDGGQGPFLVLENLMLERVQRIGDETGNRPWIVSGTLTEYGGHNYLLLQRAVVAAEPVESGPPAPATAAERS